MRGAKMMMMRSFILAAVLSLDKCVVSSQDPQTNSSGNASHPVVKCEKMTIGNPAKHTYRPSEEVQFNCTCFNDYFTPLCPNFANKEEATGKINVQTSFNETKTTCTSIRLVTAKLEALKGRQSLEVPFLCEADGLRNETIFRFQKQPSGGECDEDVDCLHEFQKCVNKTCVCYEDTPVYVKEVTKCFPASSYGEKCEFDEQCQVKDSNAICGDKTCKCRDKFEIKSETDHTCFSATCKEMTIEGPAKQTLLPSEEVFINCTCHSVTSPPACPEFKNKHEADGKISIDSDFYINDTTCTSIKSVTAKLEAFTNTRSIEVPFTCHWDGTRSETIFRFEKQPNGGTCKEDMDCLHEFQKCHNQTCSCYEDTPVFVKEVNNCVPASSYGQKCEYNEECQATDSNAICEDKICKCKEHYWIKDDSNTTCVTGQCPNMKMLGPVRQTILPSEEVIIYCTCFNNHTPACPEIKSMKASEGVINIDSDYQLYDKNCTTTGTITAKLEAFKDSRRIEIPFVCSWDSVQNEDFFRFEKQPNGGTCDQDVDCFHEFQKCEKRTCSCYEDTPAYVTELNKCFPASSYGQKCEYNEECQASDPMAICGEKVCKCKDNFRVKSDSDHTCIPATGGTVGLLPSQAMIAGIVTCALFVTGLKM